MAGIRGVAAASAWVMLLALAGCANRTDTAPAGPRDTGSPGVDLQIRGVVEFVPPGSAEEPPSPTCDGQDEPVADCVAANLDAEEIVLAGAEPDGGTYVLGPVIVDASDVQQAVAVSPPTGSTEWVVQIQLTPAGTSTFASATETLAGRRVAIVIDGEILSAPTVQVPITSGAIQLQGSFDQGEAAALASHLTRQTDASP